jgi:hypothetical protein
MFVFTYFNNIFVIKNLRTKLPYKLQFPPFIIMISIIYYKYEYIDLPISNNGIIESNALFFNY